MAKLTAKQKKRLPKSLQKAILRSKKRVSKKKVIKKKVRGFKKNAKLIANRQSISLKKASAILAAGARKASAKAKRKNPRLKRVKGKRK